jgi:hypothetical protein
VLPPNTVTNGQFLSFVEGQSFATSDQKLGDGIRTEQGQSKAEANKASRWPEAE